MWFDRFFRRILGRPADDTTRDWSIERSGQGVAIRMTQATDAGLPPVDADSPDVEAVFAYQASCDAVRDLLQEGRFAEAKPIAEEVVRRAAELAGSESAESAIGIRNLAWICEETGDPRAQGLYEEAVAICEEVLGFDHERTIRYRVEWERFQAVGHAGAAGGTDLSTPPQDRPSDDSLNRVRAARDRLEEFLDGPVSVHQAVQLQVGGDTVAIIVTRDRAWTYCLIQSASGGWDARGWERAPSDLEKTDEVLALLQTPSNVVWTEDESEVPDHVRQLIRYAFDHFGDDPLPFEYTRKELHGGGEENAVIRRTFRTGMGRVTVHTRRVTNGTQIVCQSVEANGLQSRIANLFHDAKTMGLNYVGELESVPF